jgi:hypothetical protein
LGEDAACRGRSLAAALGVQRVQLAARGVRYHHFLHRAITIASENAAINRVFPEPSRIKHSAAAAIVVAVPTAAPDRPKYATEIHSLRRDFDLGVVQGRNQLGL